MTVTILHFQESTLTKILFVASELSGQNFDAAVEMTGLFENHKLKGQRASKRHLKESASQKAVKVSIPYSKFKCLRGDLESDEILDVLTKVINSEWSVCEMENELRRIKEMRALQNFLVKYTQCETWDETKAR